MRATRSLWTEQPIYLSSITKLTMDAKTRAQSPEERLYRIMLLFGIGVDESKGKLVLSPKDHLDL